MNVEGSPLGKSTDYPERYDASLLFSMPRAPQREVLGWVGELPFRGFDLWTAYELTWLDLGGKPQIAVGRMSVPADSPRLVESKSLKLYLGSLAQERLADRGEVARTIEADLARACGASVTIDLEPAGDTPAPREALPGESLDALAIETDAYAPTPAFLQADGTDVEETLRTALFRSRCPVTGQPDYGDVMIRYRGPRIDRPGLLKYLVSYRRHAAFHEACVESIFVDVLRRCAPTALSVYARFLRRGGIDINPFRTNFETAPPERVRTRRQ
jgi:7-cyano-7-deazaguanine reductase